MTHVLKKKIMLLGGNRYQIPVIRAAHALGLHVITCDYLPNNYAHKFSDEYCNASVLDQKAVLKAATDLRVDGIMSFACDPGVVTAAYVAEKLGLPHSGSFEAVSILQNKGRFRKFLSDHGFNVPMSRTYRAFEALQEETELFHWPVIVKPTDSAGSKGVSRVDSPDQLQEAFVYAMDHSFCKEVIVEDFLEKQGASSDTDSFSIDGELRFVSFNAQYFDAKAINPYTPAAYGWPATISETHQRELTGEIQRLLKLLGMRSSIYNIETRECIDGKAYIMECSPRGGGNRLAEVLKYATGVDLIRGAVQAAIGETVDDVDQIPYNGAWAEVVIHSDAAGIFKELWVAEDVRDNVVERDLWVQPGDHVDPFEAANDSLGTLVFRFNTQGEMRSFVDSIRDNIRVILR